MSILIKNGLIYDGRGQPPFKADVMIRGNVIAGLGDLSKSRSLIVIDAKENIVMPGFVDINSALDRYLDIIQDPHQENTLKRGITSAIGGSCGLSLAPIFSGSLKHIREWGLTHETKTNIDWHQFDEFLNSLSRGGLGINFGSLVGHSVIKKSITGDTNRDLTEKEIELSKKILKKALHGGAFGLSVGLEYTSSKNTPLHELSSLAEVLQEEKKIYASHLHCPEDPESSLDEIMQINAGDNAKIEINHLQPLESQTEDYRKIMSAIEKHSSKKHINFDCYPFGFSIMPIYKFLPEWLQNGDLQSMTETVISHRLEKDILSHLKNISAKKIIFARLPKSLEFLEMKSAEEIAIDNNQTQAETILKIMRMTSLKAVCLYENIDEKTLEEFMSSASSFIASNGIDITLNANPFTKFLEWAEKSSGMPLEKAISKITSAPAQKYGIKNRGIIKEGNCADVIILEKNTVRDVIIGGKLAVKDGESQKILNGQILKS